MLAHGSVTRVPSLRVCHVVVWGAPPLLAQLRLPRRRRR